MACHGGKLSHKILAALDAAPAGLRQAALARRCGVSRQAIHQAMPSLVAQGLVVRASTDADVSRWVRTTAPVAPTPRACILDILRWGAQCTGEVAVGCSLTRPMASYYLHRLAREGAVRCLAGQEDKRERWWTLTRRCD